MTFSQVEDSGGKIVLRSHLWVETTREEWSRKVDKIEK
jgi:hypothetical protein